MSDAIRGRSWELRDSSICLVVNDLWPGEQSSDRPVRIDSCSSEELSTADARALAALLIEAADHADKMHERCCSCGRAR